MNDHPSLINDQILASTGAKTIDWVSPLRTDEFAEYRDGAALERVGVAGQDLAEFWPRRGPQWDSLATLGPDGVVLVEAKAHIDELFSGGCQAGEASLQRIFASLADTQAFIGARPEIPWTGSLYQTCNRLAHLYYLRHNAQQAWLVNCYFTGDSDMNGPATAQEWQAALRVTNRMLGVPKSHPLSPFCIDVFIDVADLNHGAP